MYRIKLNASVKEYIKTDPKQNLNARTYTARDRERDKYRKRHRLARMRKSNRLKQLFILFLFFVCLSDALSIGDQITIDYKSRFDQRNLSVFVGM